MTTRVLVLGGYGNFGKRICESLAGESGVELVVAGRNLAKAQRLCDVLAKDPDGASMQSIEIDIDAVDFAAALGRAEPDVVVHTCGPIQGQDHRVA
ncbi:MAG: saccharopine dehydrogenase NADP-binding domain-containing protein, partial [Gammaproteobacteria bacterium]